MAVMSYNIGVVMPENNLSFSWFMTQWHLDAGRILYSAAECLAILVNARFRPILVKASAALYSLLMIPKLAITPSL